MKNINLLPKKTFMEQYFILFLILLILMISTASYYHYELTRQQMVKLDEKREAKTAIEQQIQKLSNDLQIDQMTTDYLNYKDRITAVKDSRTDWVPVFETLTTQLKSPSTITSMEFNDKEVLTVEFIFVEYEKLVEYLVLLEKSPLFEIVSPYNIEGVQGNEYLFDFKLEIKLPN
jgi:Tfp pilus assembly protein PilN